MTQKIDTTPTWTAIVPILVSMIDRGAAARETAIAELTRLAGIADASEGDRRKARELDRFSVATESVARAYTSDELRAWSKAIDTAIDDSWHFAKDSDDDGAEREQESDALSAIARMIDSARAIQEKTQ